MCSVNMRTILRRMSSQDWTRLFLFAIVLFVTNFRDNYPIVVLCLVPAYVVFSALLNNNTSGRTMVRYFHDKGSCFHGSWMEFNVIPVMCCDKYPLYSSDLEE